MNFCSTYTQNLMIYALSARRLLPSSFVLFRMLTLAVALPTELRRNDMNFLLRLCTKSDDLCIIDSETFAVLFRSFSDANPYGCSTD